MGRPKGSKTKKIMGDGNISLGDLIAQRTEARDTLEAEREELTAAMAEQRARMKELKSQIKKLDKELSALVEQKAKEDAAAAAMAAKEAVQSRIDALMSEGKTLEDIMNMLG